MRSPRTVGGTNGRRYSPENRFDSASNAARMLWKNVQRTGISVMGFVPPHNRPMTWFSKGAFSLAEIAECIPFFQMGDGSQLVKELQSTGYDGCGLHVRTCCKNSSPGEESYRPRLPARWDLGLRESLRGFDERVISHIYNTEFPTYTVSAHPLMLSLKDKTENKENFQRFLDAVAV